MLRITSAYVKSNVQTKWMYFLIEDDDLILSRIKSALIQKNDSEPLYNKTFLKTKIKSHGHEITYFYDKNSLRWILIILV